MYYLLYDRDRVIVLLRLSVKVIVYVRLPSDFVFAFLCC